MRLFVAIEIASDIRKRMVDFMNQAQPRLTNARWVRPEGLHITLKFLGNVADQRRSAIDQALRGVKGTPFGVSLQKIGLFPNPRSPRVLWAGVEAGAELVRLATSVDEALTPVGFEREKRTFTPHVTLARFKEESGTQSVSSAVPESNPSFGTMIATEFHLYESRLSPKGSSYSKLASFALR